MVDPSEVTAAITGLREAVSLVRNLTKLFGASRKEIADWQDRKAAASLDVLAFVELHEPIARIASGAGLPDDLRKITTFIDKTEKGIKRHIERLNRYEPRLREKFGLRRALEFRSLLGLKSQLRHMVKEINRYNETDSIILVDLVDPLSILRGECVDLLDWIDEMNEQLIKLHDDILPPQFSKKPSKPSVRKGEGSRALSRKS